MGLAWLLAAGCVTPISAYLNSTETADSDMRRLVSQWAWRVEQPDADWLVVKEALESDGQCLARGHRVFQRGPRGSGAMLTAANALIFELAEVLALTREAAARAVVEGRRDLDPSARVRLRLQLARSRMALRSYAASREKLRR